MQRKIKILWVDDELKRGRRILYAQAKVHLLTRNTIVEMALTVDEAIKMLSENNSYEDQYDILLIDQNIHDPDAGQKLGYQINAEYPFIVLAMITGNADDLETCKNVMRTGFSDFIGLGEIEEELESTLNRILNLPTLTAKANLRLKFYDQARYFQAIFEEINKQRISDALKENAYFIDVESDTDIEILDAQEKVISTLSKMKGGYHDLMKKRTIDHLICEVREGKDLTESHVWQIHHLPKKLNTNSVHLGFRKTFKIPNTNHRIEVINDNALKVIHLLKHYSDRWAVTIDNYPSSLIEEHYEVLKQV